MKRLLPAVVLAFAPALASAEGAYDLLRALGGNNVVIPVEVPRAAPVKAGTVKPLKAVLGELKKADVAGEGSVHGSALTSYRGGREGIGGGIGSGRNIQIPVEGAIKVTGPDGATGTIRVTGSIMVFGTVTPNTQAHVGGSGPLYKDGKIVGTAEVSGSGPANVGLMGDAYARGSAVITVTGTFKPAD